MASTRPSNVSTFIEKPIAAITVNDATIEIGMVTAGIIVARTVPMNA